MVLELAPFIAGTTETTFCVGNDCEVNFCPGEAAV
jgi:hypothetical protein